jgi:hypothetical protein
MLSKKLIGSFMLFGPFLAIASLFIEPEPFDESTFAEVAQAMANNYALATISMIGWAAAILVIFIGIHYLARSMQGEEKPGSDLAGLASVFALLAAGVTMVSLGIDTTIGEKESSWVEQGGDVVNAHALSAAISRSVFIFNGIVMLFLGLAIVRQKNLNQIVGGLFAFFGACILFGGIFSAGDNWAGMIWFVGFLGFPIMTAAMGFLILRSAGKDAA